MLAGKAVMLALILSVMPICTMAAIPESGAAPSEDVVYGSNPSAGAFFEHDGVRLYYEVYGDGQPLLLIHGNGASIWALKRQIQFFRQHYRVIAMDSRDHGRSTDSDNALTFESMTDDLAALLDHVHATPALVLGWSDGAIEALLLGMRHPEKVAKIAAMAANLDPEGLSPEMIALMGPPPKNDPAHKPTRAERVEALDRDEPHIKAQALEAMSVPTLVLAADHDLIADEHTMEIYHHLPNSQLAIFPNATHMIPIDDPSLFNAPVDRFFRTPFVKKQRVGDIKVTIDKLRVEYSAEHRQAEVHAAQ